MLIIDGQEAGGQLLRTALALSVLTATPFKMINIRSKRGNPGIKTQHLEGIRAVKELFNAEVKGDKLGSKELIFKPNNLVKNEISIKIPTAGSIGLLLQTLLLIGTKYDLFIQVKGGATYNQWAPPVSYLQNVLSVLLKKMGYDFNIKINKEGFYPKGGAEVFLQTKKTNLKPLNIIEKGELINIKGISTASNSLKEKKVAERLAKKSEELLKNYFKTEPIIKINYCDTLNPGCGLQLTITTKNSIIGADGLGELRKPAEDVSKEAVNKLIFEYNNAAVDSFSADQLIPYLGLVGKGKIKTSKITNHIKTNCSIVEKFLPIKFKIGENITECFSV